MSFMPASAVPAFRYPLRTGRGALRGSSSCIGTPRTAALVPSASPHTSRLRCGRENSRVPSLQALELPSKAARGSEVGAALLAQRGA